MKHLTIKRAALWLCASLLALTLLPLAAQATGLQRETVTILVDFTTPTGTTILGTIVGHRIVDVPTTTEYTFTGTVNGLPAHASATVTERWADDGHAQIEVTALPDWQIPGVDPTVRQFSVVQIAKNLITVNGLPVAIDGNLQAPGGGRTTYIATNPGRGPLEILALPNTGVGPAAALGSLELVGLPGTPTDLIALMLAGVLAGISGLLAWTARPWRKAAVHADRI